MGSLNIRCSLFGAVFVALAVPTLAAATPVTGEAPQLGQLLGQSDDSLLFDGAGGGFAAASGSSAIAPFALRPATDPQSLVLTSTDSGTTVVAEAPLPGALVLLLGGLGVFWFAGARRKSA